MSSIDSGLGGGAVMPIATTIVGDIYTTEERAKIQGYLSSVWGISAVRAGNRWVDCTILTLEVRILGECPTWYISDARDLFIPS